MKRLVLVAALSISPAGAHAANEISRFVIAGGGIGATGGEHRIRSTLGQSVTGGVSAATHDLHSGFWIVDDSVVGVDEEAGLPIEFALYPSLPNPFRASTLLRYDVPRSGGRVQLRIYDIEGRVVRMLVDREQSPGRKTAVWDGRDHRGHRVSLGIYLCSMRAPGYERTQKLVVMN